MTIRSGRKIVVIGGGFAGMATIGSLVRRLVSFDTQADLLLIDAGTGHALIPEIPQMLERGEDHVDRAAAVTKLWGEGHWRIPACATGWSTRWGDSPSITHRNPK